jgi:hypothetical protein
VATPVPVLLQPAQIRVLDLAEQRQFGVLLRVPGERRASCADPSDRQLLLHDDERFVAELRGLSPGAGGNGQDRNSEGHRESSGHPVSRLQLFRRPRLPHDGPPLQWTRPVRGLGLFRRVQQDRHR